MLRLSPAARRGEDGGVRGCGVVCYSFGVRSQQTSSISTDNINLLSVGTLCAGTQRRGKSGMPGAVTTPFHHGHFQITSPGLDIAVVAPRSP